MSPLSVAIGPLMPLTLMRSKNFIPDSPELIHITHPQIVFPRNHFAYQFLYHLSFDQGNTIIRMVRNEQFIIEIGFYIVVGTSEDFCRMLFPLLLAALKSLRGCRSNSQEAYLHRK